VSDDNEIGSSGSRKVEELKETYRRLGKNSALVARPKPKKKKVSDDPWFPGQEGAISLMKIATNVIVPEKVSRTDEEISQAEGPTNDEQFIYMTELFALIVLNARNCPVATERKEEIREEAFQFYQRHREEMP
jgi:hypothetical protein